MNTKLKDLKFTPEVLRMIYEAKTGNIVPSYDMGNDIEYVEWLENKICEFLKK